MRIIEFFFYLAKNEVSSDSGISDILPLNSENRLKIIRIAKHPACPDNRFSRQLIYLILILREARFRKAETNMAAVGFSSAVAGHPVMGRMHGRRILPVRSPV